MWQKHFKIAERQFLAGKHRNVEEHALKALQFARDANDDKQVAQTLSFLGTFYMETDNPKAGEMLSESVAVADKAYGPNSPEFADELEILALHLEYVPNFDDAETARVKALEIRESLQQEPQVLMHSLDYLSEFYMKQNKLAETEKYFLRALEIRKQLYGPLGVELLVEHYCDILKAQGRGEEAAELMPILEGTLTSEVEALLNDLEASDSEQLDKSIETVRDGLVSAKTIMDAEQSAVCKTRPFYELLLHAIALPHSYLKSTLARLLRMKAMVEHRPELLNEAAALMREVLEHTDNPDDTLRLMLTLLEQAKTDEAHYTELDALIAKEPDSAAKFYTKALAMFTRFGSTAETRSAFKAAVEFNPHVILGLSGEGEFELHEQYEPGTRDEAQAYCIEAIFNWRSTPGAMEFMTEVIGRRTAGGRSR